MQVINHFPNWAGYLYTPAKQYEEPDAEKGVHLSPAMKLSISFDMRTSVVT